MKLKPIPQDTVVHTPTEEEAKELLAILHENGYKWCGGTSLIEDSEWEAYQEWTCYYISSYVEIGNIYEHNEDKTNPITIADFKRLYCKEEKPQPRFKVGDKVKIVNVRNPMMLNEIGIIEEHPAKNSPLYKVKWGEDSSTFIEGVFFEPYTEPETKPTENMKTKEKQKGEKGNNSENFQLDLCELLKGHEGEKFYSPIVGDCTLKAITDYIYVAVNDHPSYCFFLDGRRENSGAVVFFPSRALYEQYPLDPYTAWMKWQEGQKGYSLSLSIVGNDFGGRIISARFRITTDRNKCIEEINAIIEKYSRR